MVASGLKASAKGHGHKQWFPQFLFSCTVKAKHQDQASCYYDNTKHLTDAAQS